jgi:hypothetical protein
LFAGHPREMARFVNKKEVARVVKILTDELVGLKFELYFVVAFDLSRNVAGAKIYPHLIGPSVNCAVFVADALLVGSMSCPVQPSWKVGCAWAMPTAKPRLAAIITSVEIINVIGDIGGC